MSDASKVISLHYRRDLGWAGSLALEVTRAGEATAFVSFDQGTAPRIGSFRSRVGSQRFESLLDGIGRIEGSDPAPTLVPGMKATSIAVRREGSPSVDFVGTFVSLPPAAAAALAALEAIIAELKAHPARALSAAAKWTEPPRRRGVPARLAIKLSNVGRDALTLTHATAPRLGWNSMRLAFVDGRRDEQQLDLTRTDVGTGASSAAEIVALVSGESLTFEVLPRIDVEPGTYEVRLELHLPERETAQEHVAGTLAIDAGRHAVGRRSW